MALILILLSQLSDSTGGNTLIAQIRHRDYEPHGSATSSHVMNQMGHEFPNMVGMKPGGLNEKIRPLLPACMTHGHTGMDMGKMAEVRRLRA
jgi:hypothetical protein